MRLTQYEVIMTNQTKNWHCPDRCSNYEVIDSSGCSFLWSKNICSNCGHGLEYVPNRDSSNYYLWHCPEGCTITVPEESKEFDKMVNATNCGTCGSTLIYEEKVETAEDY